MTAVNIYYISRLIGSLVIRKELFFSYLSLICTTHLDDLDKAYG